MVVVATLLIVIVAITINRIATITINIIATIYLPPTCRRKSPSEPAFSVVFSSELSVACSNGKTFVSGIIQGIVTYPVDCYWNCPMDFRWHVPM